MTLQEAVMANRAISRAVSRGEILDYVHSPRRDGIQLAAAEKQVIIPIMSKTVILHQPSRYICTLPLVPFGRITAICFVKRLCRQKFLDPAAIYRELSVS